MQSQQRFVLFHSKYCRGSVEVIKALQASPVNAQVVRICVESHRNMIPSWVKAVPTLHDRARNMIAVGPNIMQMLFGMGAGGGNQQAGNMQRQAPPMQGFPGSQQGFPPHQQGFPGQPSGGGFPGQHMPQAVPHRQMPAGMQQMQQQQMQQQMMQPQGFAGQQRNGRPNQPSGSPQLDEDYFRSGAPTSVNDPASSHSGVHLNNDNLLNDGNAAATLETYLQPISEGLQAGKRIGRWGW